MELHLSDVQDGTKVCIKSVDVCSKVRQQLTSLGLFNGCEITVISSMGCGPVIVGIKGSRVALGRCMTENIVVEEIE